MFRLHLRECLDAGLPEDIGNLFPRQRFVIGLALDLALDAIAGESSLVQFDLYPLPESENPPPILDTPQANQGRSTVVSDKDPADVGLLTVNVEILGAERS